MAEVYDPPRARKRRMRPVLVTLAILVVLLGVGLIVADRAAAAFAERVIAERISGQVASQGARSEHPDVTVMGVPFLTQVTSGKYEETRIVLRNFEGPAGGGKSIRVPELEVRATDVSAPLDTVRSGRGDIFAGKVTGTGTVDYAQLAALIGQPGLTLREQDGKLVGTAPVQLLGQTVQVTGTASLEVVDGVVRVRFSDVTAAGLPNLPLVRSFIDAYVKDLAVDLKVPKLPLGLVVEKVEPLPAGLQFTASAHDVALTGGV
ncbi:DUF2993 family protein [Krasilnikovia cinnamomea]|uniref:DUF2993 family protein n=1 Tax=Krasilnikovia cinnamomea TaxID=349313 RepID=A0A4Q7ZK10_9ACTN|nr:DUF2993 domain-containing protein [Krasilnikovia cinnamomea]RZU50509.1 DUF2993 family protein [Krasilnikovia cinnamomea]